MTLIKNALIVTMNKRDRVMKGDILIQDGVIKGLGGFRRSQGETIDARGLVAFPGFIQSHVHLNQTLFRNLVDDLPLLKWLKTHIWPMEAAHDRHSIRAAARLGMAEMLLSGTTTFASMETVHHTENVLQEVDASGMRAIVGKCLMDVGDGVPAKLKQTTAAALAEAEELLLKWHGYDNGRIQYALAPRFAVTSSRRLLQGIAKLAQQYQVRVHTHASETKGEVAAVRKRFGTTNLQLFKQTGLLDSPLIIAHGLYLTALERRLLRERGGLLVHCPSTNLKLGSGIADIPLFLKEGIQVGLGADGAPCNNNLDLLREMRLAALLQKPHYGPENLPARRLLSLATREAAAALGMEAEIGSIAVGKQADLALFDLETVATVPGDDPITQLVYSAGRENLRHLFVRGECLVRDGRLTHWDEQTLVQNAREQSRRLRRRVKR